ncbi:MAG: hypothetical protein HY267_01720 [Deltaproteobacteria bacterium]|nr:hypothetical protein [Deltaproteobacteria bacterium]
MSIAIPSFPDVQQRDPLFLFLGLSLLLHLLAVLFFPLSGHPVITPPQEQLAEVELLPPPRPSPPTLRPPAAAPRPEAKATPPPVQKEEPAKKEEEKSPAKPLELPREQIVSPPDNANDQVPDKTRLLSDRNSATKEETVAIGNPLPSSPQKEKPQPQVKPEPQKPPTQLAMKTPETKPATKPPIEKAIEKALEKQIEKPHETTSKEDPLQKNRPLGKPDAPAATPKLFASPDDLLAQGWLSNAEREKAAAQKEERQIPQGRDLIALAPPPAEGLFNLPGAIGTPDLLPDVRQGSLTFLNTKAHRFAPFVRRVALRVFQHLIIYQRKELKLDDVVAAREMVTVQVKLDVQGNLKKLLIQTRSGSYAVDSSLLEACKQGAWDENPPAEALAEDGYINFIFRSNIDPQYDQLGLRAIITYLQIGLL